MFRITAMVGKKCQKLPLYSQASAMKVEPRPTRVPPPMASSSPPMCTPGSSPASTNTCASMEVVVVLPWVPLTHTAFSKVVMSRPSSTARSIWGMPSRAASARSGLSSGMAAE